MHNLENFTHTQTYTDGMDHKYYILNNLHTANLRITKSVQSLMIWPSLSQRPNIFKMTNCLIWIQSINYHCTILIGKEKKTIDCVWCLKQFGFTLKSEQNVAEISFEITKNLWQHFYLIWLLFDPMHST